MPDTMTSMEAPAFRNRSASIAALAAALAAAQKSFASIPKDREVTVTSDRGNYKFKYATLDAILAATLPALNDQGLALTQALTDWGNNYAIETTLYHSSGEWISNVTPMFLSGRRIKNKDGQGWHELPPGNQDLGSSQSFARRYGVSALLCITADEDDDANHADGNHAESQRIPYKPAPGTAGAGKQFRPERRQLAGRSWADDEPHLVDATREKGTLPAKPANDANGGNAIRRIEWCRAAADIIKNANTKDELSAWWEANAERLGVIETALPQEHDRLIVTFDDAMTRVLAKVS